MKSYLKLLLSILLATILPLRGMKAPEEGHSPDAEDKILFYAQDGKLAAALPVRYVAAQAPGIVQIISETGSQSIQVPHSPETVKFVTDALFITHQPLFDKNNLEQTELYADLKHLTIEQLIAIGNCATWTNYEILHNATALALTERCTNSTMYSPDRYMDLGLNSEIADRVKQQLKPSHNQQLVNSTQLEVTLELADGQIITVPRSQAECFSSLKNILANLEDDNKSIPLPNLTLSPKETQLLFSLAEILQHAKENDKEKVFSDVLQRVSLQIQNFTFDQINELLAASDYLGSDLLINASIAILEEKLKQFVVTNDNTQLEYALHKCTPLLLDRMAQQLLNNKSFMLQANQHYTIDSKILDEHAEPITSLAFSPDGKILATGSDNTTIKLWDITNNTCIYNLAGHSDIECLAFSPDRKILATGWNRKINLWDLTNGTRTRSFKGHTEEINCLAFSPNGKTLATGSDDQTIKLWDVTNGKRIYTLTGHTGPINCSAFTPNGKILATGSNDETIKLWDLTNGTCIRTLTDHTRTIRCLAFSPDGKILATGSWDKTLKLWDVTNGTCIRTLTGHTEEINCLAFSPDGKILATGSWDETIKLWDVTNGKCIRTLTDHSDIEYLAFSPDGTTLATGSEDTTVRLWNLSPLKQLSHQQLLLLKLSYEAYKAKATFAIQPRSFLQELYQSCPEQIQKIVDHFLQSSEQNDDKEKETEN